MSAKPQRVSRDEVAKLAGTSVAVVSYVINNGPRPVAKETRQRVLDAIKATGYRPNRIARALAAGNSGTVGLVVPDISNPFFAELAYQLEKSAFMAGKILLLSDTAESPEREAAVIENLLQTQVDGLIYVGVGSHGPLQRVIESQTPVVVLDRTESDLTAHAIVIDNSAAAARATHHLITHGFERVDTIAGPKSTSTGRLRAQGWEQALQAAGLDPQDSRLVRAPFTREGGAAAAAELLAQAERPRALFVASEQQALGALYVAWKLGIDVPNDLAIVSFDGTEASRFATPPLTTIVQPTSEIAEKAIETLVGVRRNAREVFIDFDLVIRASCGCEHHADLDFAGHDLETEK